MGKRKPNTDPSITSVIFRKFSNGDVIALFPYIPGNTDGWTCQSFMHVGQHGAADPHIVRRTKPATQDEARDLVIELTSDPYRYPPLRILKRFPADAHDYRRAEIARQRAGEEQ